MIAGSQGSGPTAMHEAFYLQLFPCLAAMKIEMLYQLPKIIALVAQSRNCDLDSVFSMFLFSEC